MAAAIATFILSTGRSGTQWLAQTLRTHYSDRARVTHEPLFIHYRPRSYFANGDITRAETADRIRAHFDTIAETLETRPYIECGWESFAALPHLAHRFAGRMRIVHLTRHPATTASSMVTHNYYQGRPDGLTEKALLTPFDDGVRHPEYRARWADMDVFEKCLFFWLEVHAHGLALERTARVPWLRLRCEDMFAGDALEGLLGFLDLPVREPVLAARAERIDKHQWKSDARWEVGTIARHEAVIACARTLGYDALAVDAEAVRARYQRDPLAAQGVDPADPATWSRLGRNADCPCGSGRRYKHCHGSHA